MALPQQSATKVKEKNIIYAARAISALFSPFYLAIVGLAILFVFSYLSLLPLGYKLSVLAVVYLCTVLLPTFLIRVYRRYQGWSRIELGTKERRMIPYVIAILCYFLCYYLMNLLHIPHFMSSIIVAALGIQVVCAIINLWWKVSTHTAAIGGVAGALLGFSVMFMFNPTWWFCLVILLAGMVGTARMVLRQPSLQQVVAGFLIGLVIALFAVIHV